MLAVVDARSPDELAAALDRMAGGAGRRLAATRSLLLDLLADIEAAIDFADETMPDAVPAADAATWRRVRDGLADTAAVIDDVANGIADKLIRRHPHVFPNAEGALVVAETAADVEANWQNLKNAEKQRQSVVEGVPTSLPPLTQISKLLQRLENAGRPHLVQMRATSAIESALLDGIKPADLVLAAISAMRAQGLDPESEMRQKALKLRSEIQADEARIAAVLGNSQPPSK